MKGILKNWHRYLLWATVSFFFWAWIFTFLTDAPAQKKLVLYADAPAMERDALAAALEQDMPAHIRFVEARVFSDEMFQPSNLARGDVYIIAESDMEQYFNTFTLAPLDPAAFPGLPLYELEGQAYGVCVYNEDACIHSGSKYLAYLPGETYYLFFNAGSKHLTAADGASMQAARAFLALP